MVRQIGVSIINLRSSWSGVYLFVGSIASVIINFSHLREFQFLQNNSKILLCVFIDGESGPCPKSALDAFSLFLHPLPSLINSCLPQPTGTQGSSWKLSEGCFLQSERGTQKGLVPRSPTGSGSVSLWQFLDV